MYTAVFQSVAQTVQQDCFEVQPADDKPTTLYQEIITQETEVGDAQEEFIRMDLVRGNTASGSGGGSNPTLRTTDRNNTVSAGATVEINNTTKANTAGVFVSTEIWSIRGGFYHIPIPELRITASQGDTTLCPSRTVNTPADSITSDGALFIEEN